MNKVYNRFQTKTAQNVKNCTLCGGTYRYSLYKGVLPRSPLIESVILVVMKRLNFSLRSLYGRIYGGGQGLLKFLRILLKFGKACHVDTAVLWWSYYLVHLATRKMPLQGYK